MKRKIPFILTSILLIYFLLPLSVYALPGDADGNGIVNLDDARIIARFAVKQIPSIPNPSDADANQDGKIDMEDAFIIAQKVTGQTRIVVVAPRYGSSDMLKVGDTIRIEVFEKFFPLNITGGKVRILSTSTGYDSGDIPLTFERDGRSLYYHWGTGDLKPASDFEIKVTLDDSGLTAVTGKSFSNASQVTAQPDATVSLTSRVFEPLFLASATDAVCPAPGISLGFRRLIPNDSSHYPYLGPLGRGWVHQYDISLEEYTDGRIAFHGPEGFNRFFQSNPDGTYTPSPGDYGTLTRDPDGTFQLKEKDGFIYRFRSDLRLNYEEDLNKNRISAVYDSSNRLVEIHHSCGKSLLLEYNSAERIIKLTDPAGRVTNYEYDPTNLMLTKVTNPAGNVTEYAYNVGQSDVLNYRLQSIAFPDGTHVHYEYDSNARLVKQTGTWGANPVVYSYDADGTTHLTDALGKTTSIVVNDRGQPTLIQDPLEAKTLNQYDTSANLTQITDPLSHTTQFAYDGFGNTTLVTNPLNQVVQFGYDLRFNKPSWIKNPLGKTTSFAYNSKGNLTTTTYPDSNKEIYAYDTQGNLTSVQDAVGKTTQYSYNDQAQMTSLKNALGNVTQFSYDTAGDLQDLTDAKGHIISHSRDILGRLIQRTYPDNSYEDYEYDAAGKVIAFTNRRREKITFSYDTTGRLEWKIYSSGKKLHFFYDATGYLASVEEVMEATTTLDTAYERDALHRITKVKVLGQVTPGSYDVSYTYDATGNRTFMVYPDGYALNYTYDAANRLMRISDASNNTIVAYEYDAAGRRTRRNLGNGTYTTYEYDDLDRLTLLVNYASNGVVQSQFGYTYNASGIRTAMTTLEGVHSYGYDGTYQLTSVEYPDGRAVDYAFDKVGNRTSVTDNSMVTSYATNTLDQYTQAGAETFGYDANGNLTTRTLNTAVTTYGWDEDDRLMSVDREGVHIDYRYDHQGRLVAKTVGGEEIRYIWDGLDLIAEMDSAGQVVKRYVYGSAIDEIMLVTGGPTNYWAQQDGLGSVVGTTNDSGAVVSTSSYDVYGNVRSGDLSPVPQRFAGMWWDGDAVLYHVRARWYEPRIGRFLSTDPVGITARSALYPYADNDPVNLVDRTGLQSGNPRISGWDMVIDWGWEGLEYIAGPLRSIGKTLAYLGQIQVEVEQGATSSDGRISGWDVLSDWGWEGLEYIAGPLQTIGKTLAYLGQIQVEVEQDRAQKELQFYSKFVPFALRDPHNPTSKDVIAYYRFWSRKPWAFAGQWFGVGSGGMCPTFVQEPFGARPFGLPISDIPLREEKVYGRISIPFKDALLRSDIPIFGVAAGKSFEKYQVEYGKTLVPSEWKLIEESKKPQERAPNFNDISWMQGDIDLKGNLATWNTGLKNWVHLPWHPPEEEIDLNGVYTIRLTVFGKDGTKVEDRVTVEVGRVIAQCLPGIVISPDKRVVMHFPEQSLTHPFRIYTILPLSEVGEEIPSIHRGCEFVGPVYRIREPGDKFIKDVTLEFTPTNDELNKADPKQVGICRYDSEKKEWIWLDTARRNDSRITFSTVLTELPSPKAIYALTFDPNAERSSLVLHTPAPQQRAEPVRPGLFVDCSFEKDLGTFKPRDRIVGASLSRDNKVTPDSSYCLKLVNENYGGNFSCTVLDRPFDVKEYPIMGFDYRIGPDVKIDFLIKVAGRWYNLKFTDDPMDYRNRDVNIANLGEIPGIIRDNKWHTASVDLQYLLRLVTRQTKIEEIVLADWDVGGYMKLEFGRSPRGATFYIDNFRLCSSGRGESEPESLLVDNFNLSRNSNALGGASGSYCNPGTRYSEVLLVDETSGLKVSKPSSVGHDGALQITFDMTKSDAFGGYWTSLRNHDLSSYRSLLFRIKTEGAIPLIWAGIRNTSGTEGKTIIAPYALEPDKSGWRDVKIPLCGLRGLSDLSSPDVFFLSISNKDRSGKGKVLIDDLKFDQTPYLKVSDFESPFAWNLIGGEYTTYQNAAAAIFASSMADTMEGGSSTNTVCRISYGGSIGSDYGAQGGFSFCYWQSELNGIDATPFKSLVIKIRGEKGGEIPNFYLFDPGKRVCLRAKEIPSLTKDWQEMRLPLSHFASHGIDLSHLESLQIVFEWVEQSGTIYVDDIRFEE